MLLLITYDVNTTNASGAKRLRKVAKLCEKYGVRVQNSVFEVQVDAAQSIVLKTGLKDMIDQENDSIRIYKLGNSFEHKIETIGKTPRVQIGEALIL